MNSDTLDATFFALSDPTRRDILARLTQGEASITELAEPYDMTFAAVAKHVRVLERAGLVTRGKDAQSRPCHLEMAPLKDVAAYLEYYRRFWEQSVDRLEGYLRQIQAAEKKSSKKDNN